MFRVGKSFLGVSRSVLNLSMSSNRMMSTVVSSKIFFSNIPWSTTEEQLVEHFGRVGPVSDIYLFRREDGKLTGSGTITFENQTDVQAAIENLNETDFLGRKLFVREDQGRPERSPRNYTPRGDDDGRSLRRSYTRGGGGDGGNRGYNRGYDRGGDRGGYSRDRGDRGDRSYGGDRRSNRRDGQDFE